MTRTYHIVWNESMTEGFITCSERDAEECHEGRFSDCPSCVGQDFYECHLDESRPLETVTLPPVKSHG